MHIFESSIGILGLVSSSIAAWFDYQTYRHSESASNGERQAELRAEVRRRINDQFRLVRAVAALDRGLPGSTVEADLEEFRDFLNWIRHRLIASSPRRQLSWRSSSSPSTMRWPNSPLLTMPRAMTASSSPTST